MIEYQPLSPTEVEDLRRKEARGELTREDCARFIMHVRARFGAIPTKQEKPSKSRKASGPAEESVDFF
jgi:hypothetical protein